MTRQTFYRNLRKYAHYFNWYFENDDMKSIRGYIKSKYKKTFKNAEIRSWICGGPVGKDSCYCPVTAVALCKNNEYYGIDDYSAGKTLRFADHTFIAIASDFQDDFKDRGCIMIRKTLLKILNPKKK